MKHAHSPCRKKVNCLFPKTKGEPTRVLVVMLWKRCTTCVSWFSLAINAMNIITWTWRKNKLLGFRSPCLSSLLFVHCCQIVYDMLCDMVHGMLVTAIPIMLLWLAWKYVSPGHPQVSFEIYVLCCQFKMWRSIKFTLSYLIFYVHAAAARLSTSRAPRVYTPLVHWALVVFCLACVF